jgi:hypothetical protein
VRISRGAAADQPLKAGVALMKSIESNEEVRQALQDALKSEDITPVGIQIEDGAEYADRFAWEALYHKEQGFLALDIKRPIVRLRRQSRPTRIDRDFFVSKENDRARIRILAVLAATGVTPNEELNALASARTFAAEHNIETELRVFTSKPEHVQRHSSPLPIDIVPLTNVSDLGLQIRNYRPNLLHFFCHGSLNESPGLGLATVRSEEMGGANYAIHLDPVELVEIISPDCSLWLVTLNCCSSAAKPPRRHDSFARSIVSRKVPLVVGMRTPVEVRHASIACRKLYEAIFAKLHSDVLANGDPQAYVEWADSLFPVRNELLNSSRLRDGLVRAEAASKHPEWCIPVIYTLPEEFQFLRRFDTSPYPSAHQETMNDLGKHILDISSLPRDKRERIEKLVSETSEQVVSGERTSVMA